MKLTEFRTPNQLTLAGGLAGSTSGFIVGASDAANCKAIDYEGPHARLELKDKRVLILTPIGYGYLDTTKEKP